MISSKRKSKLRIPRCLVHYTMLNFDRETAHPSGTLCCEIKSECSIRTPEACDELLTNWGGKYISASCGG